MACRFPSIRSMTLRQCLSKIAARWMLATALLGCARPDGRAAGERSAVLPTAGEGSRGDGDLAIAREPPKADALGDASDGSRFGCSSVLKWLAYPPSGVADCDTNRCRAAGGACGYGGVGCPQACFRRTSDGGKPCKDRSECQSICLAPPDTAAGQATMGSCSELVHVVGCQNRVRAGRAEGAVCTD